MKEMMEKGLKLEQRIMIVRSRYEADVNETIASEYGKGWRVVHFNFMDNKNPDDDFLIFALLLEKIG